VLRYTDAFLAAEGPLDVELARALRDEFTPAELVELGAGVALFMGFSKIAIALGQAPAAMPTIVVPTPA
jgi:hypothetical protein